MLFFGVFLFWNTVQAKCDGIFDINCNEQIIYCPDGEDCGLEKWIDIVKEDIDGIVVDKKATVFIQDIVVYLMTFITLIAILYIIYAWFKVLTGAGDEEAQWEAKKIIVSVFLWILLMWLSFAIVDFMLDVLDPPSQNTNVNTPIN
jgi:hypothetical protein